MENQANPAPHRPRTVLVAVVLLWAAVAATLAFALTIIIGMGPVQPNPAFAFDVAFTCAVYTLLAIKIRAGRNWARWLFVLFSLSWVGMSTFNLIRTPTLIDVMPTNIKLSAIGQLLLMVATLVLLFMKDSREWFRASAYDRQL